MSHDEFTHRLRGLTAEDIEQVAAAIRAELDTADGEVAWWRATIAVSGTLRRAHRSRQASLAAHRAATAVLEAARDAGLCDTHRDAVVAVARAASEAARVLVAADAAAMPAPAHEPLLHPWHQVAA